MASAVSFQGEAVSTFPIARSVPFSDASNTIETLLPEARKFLGEGGPSIWPAFLHSVTMPRKAVRSMERVDVRKSKRKSRIDCLGSQKLVLGHLQRD
jgi:hypothetical protein